MVIKELAEGNKRCVIHGLTKAPACDMDEDPLVVLFVEILMLQNWMFFLYFLECLPFLVEGFSIYSSSTLDCLILQQI